MSHNFQENQEFRRLTLGDPDSGIDPARVALEIAMDEYPELDPSTYLAWIDELAKRVNSRCPRKWEPVRILKQIHWALFVEEGFVGNRSDYYDPRNSYLNDVIERKTGIPISLCILYQSIAAKLGVELLGVNLPAHFMLKLAATGTELFVDPFNGDFLDRKRCEERLSGILSQNVTLRDEDLSSCPKRSLIVRLLRNLKIIHLRHGELVSALKTQGRLTVLLPDDLDEARDFGVLNFQLGLLDAAIGPLENYLAERRDADDAPAVRSLLQEAHREISLRN